MIDLDVIGRFLLFTYVVFMPVLLISTKSNSWGTPYTWHERIVYAHLLYIAFVLAAGAAVAAMFLFLHGLAWVAIGGRQ